MSEGTHVFKLPMAGWKGQLTTYDAYNVDLEFLEGFLKDRGLTLPDMKATHWDEYVEHRKQGPKRSFGFSAQGRALSAGRRYLRHIGIEEHPLFEIEWPTGPRAPQRNVTKAQRDKLLAWAANTHKPERNQALIHLIWCIGGRRFEIADALWEHVDLEERSIWLLTKADDLKPRDWELKAYSHTATRALRQWKEIAPKDSKIFGLGPEGISSLWKRASAKVDFKVSSHDFRRGLGKFMADNGVSDTVGMQQMGLKNHSNYQNYTAGAEPKRVLDGIWGEDE